MPVGVLIYRLDRLLYANAAFLARMGYASLHALEEAGGLDALYVEPGVVRSQQHFGDRHAGHAFPPAQAASDAPHASAARRSVHHRWDGEPALALIFSGTPQPKPQPSPRRSRPTPISAAVRRSATPMPRNSAPILDTTAEGIVMFDADGQHQRLQPQRRGAVRL